MSSCGVGAHDDAHPVALGHRDGLGPAHDLAAARAGSAPGRLGRRLGVTPSSVGRSSPSVGGRRGRRGGLGRLLRVVVIVPAGAGDHEGDHRHEHGRRPRARCAGSSTSGDAPFRRGAPRGRAVNYVDGRSAGGARLARWRASTGSRHAGRGAGRRGAAASGAEVGARATARRAATPTARLAPRSSERGHGAEGQRQRNGRPAALGERDRRAEMPAGLTAPPRAAPVRCRRRAARAASASQRRNEARRPLAARAVRRARSSGHEQLGGGEGEQQAGDPARERQVGMAAGGERLAGVVAEADQVAQLVQHERGDGDHRGEPDCRRAWPHPGGVWQRAPAFVHRYATPRSRNGHAPGRPPRADSSQMVYADIHFHLLPGVDDGPEDIGGEHRAGARRRGRTAREPSWPLPTCEPTS